jgi:hypothetical protein
MYFKTVDWATSMPSFSSSPWILGARQRLRIRSRTYLFNLWSATETTGFPSPECGEANARDPLTA